MESAALFAPITPPILRSVDPRKVAAFLQETEHYELKVKEKRLKLPMLRVTPYKSSIDDGLLRSTLMFGILDRFATEVLDVSELTDEQICSYIDSLVTIETDAQDNSRENEKAHDDCRIKFLINDHAARVLTYCADLIDCLTSIGYGYFIYTNTKRLVKVLRSKLEPPALKREVRKNIEYYKTL